MKQLPNILAAIILLACATCTSCAHQAGQLTASELAPLVGVVTSDLEAYVAAGQTPSGEPLSSGESARILGGVVTLRNAVHAALDEPLEPLPSFNLQGSAK